MQDKRFVGLKFTRQKPLGEYIVDFHCAELMLAIEIDGDSHGEQPDYDRQRTARLKQLGIEVIRYANREIITDLKWRLRGLSEAGKGETKTRAIPNADGNPLASPLSGGH